MAGHWPKVEAISRVRPVDRFAATDAWAELIAETRRQAGAPARVSPVRLKALPAPTPADAEAWPALADGGVVVEVRTRS
jgi:hypothetical protein